MTHPLRPTEIRQARAIGRLRAAVTVRRDGKNLVIVDIGILKADALVERLPDRLQVVSEDGKPVKPSQGKIFVITIESFDPCHAVAEIPAEGF